jgi:hypothetical protein
MTERFSLCQFFEDGSYEYVREGVEVEEVMRAFVHYCTSVGAQLGTTKRVIITDEGDAINVEWKWEEGVTFGLPKLIGAFKRGQRNDVP